MKLRNKYTWLSVVFFASVAGSVGACSSSDNNGNPGDKDGGPGQDGGGNTDGGGQQPPNKKSGSVTVSNFLLGTAYKASASAGFSDATGLPDASGACETSTEGSCTIIKCGTITSNDAGAPKAVSAGVIEISGGDISPAFKLEPKSDNTYEPLDGTESLWKGGENIVIKAAGSTGGVGAFEKTLKAPPTITISDIDETIDLKKPLEVTWTFPGSAGGEVAAGLSAASGTGSVSVACKAAVGDKKVTVPASVLGKLPKGQGFLTVVAASSEFLDVSGYTVNVSASGTAKRQDGTGAFGSVTFE